MTTPLRVAQLASHQLLLELGPGRETNMTIDDVAIAQVTQIIAGEPARTALFLSPAEQQILGRIASWLVAQGRLPTHEREVLGSLTAPAQTLLEELAQELGEK